MRVKIHTAPVNEAFLSGDECPFCYLERKALESTIRFVAGPSASYMEPGVRAVTDEVGFCRAHTKALYDYGNTLGNALMMQTYFAGLIEDFRRETDNFTVPGKRPLLGRRKQAAGEQLWQRIEKKASSCYICNQVEDYVERYYLTFFHLLKEEEFRKKVEGCKGFCMPHFARLLRMAEDHLPEGQREWFYGTIFGVMESNLVRVKEDLDWLIAKYDYRNAGADWRNSKDALQRTMQKLEGGNPAEPPYRRD